jgi:hypothetical protein
MKIVAAWWKVELAGFARLDITGRLMPLRAEMEFQLAHESACRAAPRAEGAEGCGEEAEDFRDHGATILAGLVGHLRGDQKNSRKKPGGFSGGESALAWRDSAVKPVPGYATGDLGMKPGL